MNLIDAVKSGKRFKLGDRTCDWKENSPDLIFNISQNMILSDEWIIEEQEIKITKSQLEVAFNHTRSYGDTSAFHILAKRLGFT